MVKRSVAAASHASRSRASTTDSVKSAGAVYGRSLQAQKAAKLEVAKLLLAGQVQQATYPQLHELIATLSTDKKTIKGYDVEDFVAVVFSDLDEDDQHIISQILGAFDDNHDRRLHVPVDEFQAAFMSSQLFDYLNPIDRDQSGITRSKSVYDRSTVDRNVLVSVVSSQAATQDALSTLPVTLLYLGVFISMVVGHLEIYPRQRMQQSLESWVSGYGDLTGPFLERDVFDADTFFTWMDKSGIQSVFGDTRPWNGGDNVPRIAVAADVLGDASVTRSGSDMEMEEKRWLLHDAPVNATGLTKMALARATMDNLRNGTWGNNNKADELLMRWAVYNTRAQMFATMDVKLLIPPYGTAQPIVSATSTPASASAHPFIYLCDAVFFLILLFMTVSEGYQICTAARHGSRAFAGYWNLWNAVDFASIVNGWVTISLFVVVVVLMRAEELVSLIDDDLKLKTDVMALPTTSLEAIYTALGNINQVFFWLHIVVATNSLTIIFRLFKAFQSNARLRVVTDTFVYAYVDIIHFLVVLLTIFISFAVIGHVLFGNDLEEFFTVTASISTCFVVLMGDFGWYVEVTNQDGLLMASGMPRVAVAVWFWCFSLFVSLVMLNMLLAIILDRHAVVSSTFDPRDLKSRPIWTQLLSFIRQKWRTRNYLSLNHMDSALQNYGHPAENVSEETLLDNFGDDGMSQAQASWLMEILRGEVNRMVNDQVVHADVARGRRMQRGLRHALDETARATKSVEAFNDRVARLEDMVTQVLSKPSDALAEASLSKSTDPEAMWPIESAYLKHSGVELIIQQSTVGEVRAVAEDGNRDESIPAVPKSSGSFPGSKMCCCYTDATPRKDSPNPGQKSPLRSPRYSVESGEGEATAYEPGGSAATPSSEQ